MPSLEFFVVATSIAVDQDTNRLSVFDVLEEVNPERLPAIIPRAAAVSLWRLEDTELGQDFQAVLRVAVPGEEPRDMRLNFHGESKRHRLTMNLVRMLIRRPGEIRFELLLNDESRAHHHILINEPSETAFDDLTLPAVAEAVDHEG